MAVLWIALSGHFTPLLLGLGVASVLFVVWIARRMDVVDHEGHPVHLGMRAVFYWVWLCKEIVKANIDVARLILNPKMPIYPHVFPAKASQKSELGRVVYANSITLTPGTVTIALDDNDMSIHAITQAAADGVTSGDMDRRVSRIEELSKYPGNDSQGEPSERGAP